MDLGTSIDARDQKIEEDYQKALEDRTGLVTSITGAQAGGGLSQLRPGYAPGGEVMDIYSQIEEKIPMPEKRKRQGLTVGDYLRIASSGLEILGAPSEGSGFKGTLSLIHISEPTRPY